jgi:radical SAM protein with 4Fe4S-binding SPASM domain
MTNICIVDLKKDKNNFFYAGQSISTACMRDYLRRNEISSMIYMDEALPSLNDLAEDILSVADDAILFIADEDNHFIVWALMRRIRSLEDIPVYFTGEDSFEAGIIGLTDEPEKKLLKEFTGSEESSIPMMECSPYQSGILLPQDAAEYGIWLGRTDRNGNTVFRSISAISSDCDVIAEAFSGISESQKKFILLQGPVIHQKEFASQLIRVLHSGKKAAVQYILPVDLLVAACTDFWENASIILNIGISETVAEDKTIQILSDLAQNNRINEIAVKAEIFIKDETLRLWLITGARQNLFKLAIEGKMDFSMLSDEETAILLKQTSLKYAPFSRGFLKSRTGMYNTVNLDGYVKHIEVAKEDYNEKIASYINEIASINSSVFIRGLAPDIDFGQSYFDFSGIAKVEDNTYQDYCKEIKKADAAPSNLLTLQNNTLRLNDLLYTSKQGIKEISYKQAKEKIADFEKAYGTNKALFYVFSIDDEEDYGYFLSDAEKYKDTHDFAGLPLAYGYLKNYCRFMSSKCCFVDKIPRVQLDHDGSVYTCFNMEEAIGQIGQTMFELTQNCYVKKENEIKSRDCVHCKARSWCSKCTQLPSFMKDSYCTIMKDKSYIIDYIMSSLAFIQMVTTIPKFVNSRPEKIKVSSEYMYNFSNSIENGKEVPYFPKFTYVLHNEDTSVLWTIATNKFFNISREYAFVAELLLKRLPVREIPGYFSKSYNIPFEQSKEVCTYIMDTINHSGTLYRPIREN